ncbi:hypothetical protein KF840_09830 [bacterium]|nr:hypothetical protein [bacterium]
MLLPLPVVPVTRINPRRSVARRSTDCGRLSSAMLRILVGMTRMTRLRKPLAEDVDAEAAEVGVGIGEIDLQIVHQLAPAVVVEHAVDDALEGRAVERRGALQRQEVGADAKGGRHVRLQQHVRCVVGGWTPSLLSIAVCSCSPPAAGS